MKLPILALSLVILGCGGGGPDASIPVTNPNNFTGPYSLRDHNCIGSVITSFHVTPEVLFIDDPGDSPTLNAGDAFPYTRISASEAGLWGPTAIVDGLGCSAIFVDTEERASTVSGNFGIDVLVNDLLVACDDTSTDGVCGLSYIRLE